VHAAWGPAKIRAALRRMGIDAPLIAQALATLDTDAADARLDKTLRHKWQTLQKETDPRQRKAKLLRYLLQKGYTYAQIQAALVRLDIR
jgi:SOS response regulatory protein OraA/RecX